MNWERMKYNGESWLGADVSEDIAYEVFQQDDGRYIACVRAQDDRWLGQRYKTERGAIKACEGHARKLADKLVRFGRGSTTGAL